MAAMFTHFENNIFFLILFFFFDSVQIKLFNNAFQYFFYSLNLFLIMFLIMFLISSI